MATQTNGPASFLANAAISAFRGVAISNNRGIGASVTGVPFIGITQRDAEASDYVAVKFFPGPGTHKISITGCPVTVGDAIFAGANGQAYRSGGYITAAITVGYSLTTSASNGSIIEFAPITNW